MEGRFSYSLDLDNGLQNLIYSDVFNNAISSRKTFAKRYKINEYDKAFLISMFKDADNYRNFLALVDGKDIYYLKDISLVLFWSNHVGHNNIARKYKHYTKTPRGMSKLLQILLKGLISLENKHNNIEYVEGLISLLPSSHREYYNPSPTTTTTTNINQQKQQS